MKRKLFLVALLCMALLFTASVFAEDAIVYLDGTGATEGAYTDLGAAVSALPNGGTVIVTGDTTVGTTSAGVTLPAVGGKVTIQGSSPTVKLTIARSLTLSGALEFDNLTIHSAATASGNILSRGHAITFGSGISTTKESGAMWLAIFGGAGSGTVTYNTSVTVYSGTWRVIYGGNYGGTINGTTDVTVGNVTVTGTLSYANYQGTCNATGTLTFDLRGGKTVSAGIYRDGEVPTILTDAGYTWTQVNGVYAQVKAEDPAGDVRYVTYGGSGSGTENAPLGGLIAAFNALPNGGKIVILGDYPISTRPVFPEVNGDITISGEAGGSLVISSDFAFAKNSNDNVILFDLPVTVSAESINLYARFNSVTFTENFTVTGGTFNYYGGVGTAGAADGPATVAELPYTIHVYGGTFGEFHGGNFRSNTTARVGSVAAKVTINIHGGTFQKEVSLSGMSILADDAELNITGGIFDCPIYAVGGIQAVNSTACMASATIKETREYYAMDGNIVLNISGGKFNGGLISAYNTAYAAYIQLLRGNYTVTVTGGEFVNGTVFDATQVKAYAGQDKIASITYPSAYTFTVVRFDCVNGETQTYAEPLRVAFIGDSITEGYAPEGAAVDRLTQSYPAVFFDLCKADGREAVVSNYGVSASGIQETAKYYYPDMLAYSLVTEETDADIYVIALGTNDSRVGLSNLTREAYVRNYRNLVDTLAALPDTQKVVLTSAIVYDYENSVEVRIAATVRPLEEQLAREYSAMDSEKYVFVDLYGMTLSAAKAGTLLSSDRLHPGVSGYIAMGTAMYDALMKGATAPAYKRTDIYLSAQGTPFGAGTAEDPTSRMDIALGMIPPDADVTIHVSGNVHYNDIVVLSCAPHSLKIVGEGNDAVWTIAGDSFRLGCDTEFDNLVLAADAATFYANYHSLTMTDTVAFAGNWSFYAGYCIYTGEGADTEDTVSANADVAIDLRAAANFDTVSIGNDGGKLGDFAGTLEMLVGDSVSYETGNIAVGNTLSGTVRVSLPEGKTMAYAAEGNSGSVYFTYYTPAAKEPCKIPHFYQDGVCVRCNYVYPSDTAYVDVRLPNEGDGLTPATAFSTLEAAMHAFGAEGGTILLCSDIDLGTSDTGAILPTTLGKITIKGTSGQKINIWRTLRLAGDLELDDLVLNSSASTLANIYCYGHTFIVSEGVTTTKTTNYWLAVFGGGGNEALVTDTHLILHSGTWRAIFGGNYMNDLDGDTLIELGNVVSMGRILGGNYAGTHTGTSTLVVDLRGGKTVKGTWATTPTTVLTDEGWEYQLIDNTYSQYKIQTAEPRTVYLDGTGETEGAYTSLLAALNEMPGGGTIILSGRTEITTATTLPATGAVVITSVYGDEDYTRTAELCLRANLTLGADTAFKNVTFEKIHSSHLYLIAAGHTLVIDEGVACLNYQANNNISIIGGYYNAPFEGDTHLTVKSGTWRNVFGGNYYNTFSGNTYVTVSGGVFENAIVGGSYSGDFTGDTHLTVNGNATLPASKSPQGVVGATLGVDGGTARTHTGNVYLTVGGNAGISGNIFGGPRNNNITMNGNVELVFEEDAFCYFSVYAGGYAKGMNGNTHAVVNGGNLWGSLYGGSYTGTVTGDTLIEINGGKLCYYKTNEFSGGSDLPGTKNVYTSGDKGTVGGTQTLVMNGGSVYGKIIGGNVTVKNGLIFGGLSGETVTVDLTDGGEVTLLDVSAITSLIGGGKLILSAFAPITVETVLGNTEFAISGLPLPSTYITANTVEDGAQISYLAQDEETLVRSGNAYSIDFDGAHRTVELTVTFSAGMECRLRDRMLASGGWYTPISKTDTSMTYSLAPGFYSATVVSKTNNADYRRKTVYITGREATQICSAEFSANDGSGFYMSPSRSFPEGITEQYYGYEEFGVTLDTPYFTERYGTPDAIIQTTNDEVVAYVNAKAATCDYMYVFDLCTSPSGYSMPMAIFTKDPIPEGATLEEIAAILHSKGEREIIYIDGGIHGNEPSGTEGNLAFISEMCGAYGEEVLSNACIGAILVQPRLNPEGFCTSTRESLGNEVQNLNRDFMLLTSDEIASVAYIDRLFLPTIAVDCHEALFVNMTSSGLFSDIYDLGIMCFANFCSGFTDTVSVVYGDRSAAYFAGDDFVRTVRSDLESVGLRTYWYNKDRSPVYGANYHGAAGAYSFIMETPGICAGDDHMPRRTITHLLGLKSFVQIAIDGNGAYAARVAEGRRKVALDAQDYDGKTPILLQHATSRTAEVVYEWNDAILGVDGVMRVEENTVRGFNYDIAMVYRDLPTAYVFAADIANPDAVLALLDRQGIAYTKLPAGTSLTLQRYAGTTTAATLGNAENVTFAQGAYIVPVDTSRAYSIAYLFEPDHRDATEKVCSLAQFGLLEVTDIYRSTERFIAAKMGIAGTYTAVDIPEGKTIESVTVDGAAPERMAVEDGKVFLAPEDPGQYTATLFFTDGTKYSIGLVGDVNGDGKITLLDALTVLRCVVNHTDLAYGDMNDDGKITLLDVIKLLKLVAN